jgi:ABC-2 type transport system permease protein
MLKYLVEKEFRQLGRNSFLPRLILLFPVIVLLLLPLAATFEVRNINLAVVDHDHGTLSMRMVNKIFSSGYFTLIGVFPDYRSALGAIETNAADIILEIPQDFESQLQREHSAAVLVAVNAVNGTRGALGSAYISGIIGDFGARSAQERAPDTLKMHIPFFDVIPRYLFNPHLEYPVFMVPALMVILLTMLCGFLPALNIVAEKEKGTMEQMNVTPVPKFTLILSKLVPYWVIGFVVLSIGFGIARLFYGLVPSGNIFVIYLFASVFILAMSGFGLVISNYANTLQQAMFMMFFFVITFIFMSGLYTPVNSMPGWAQLISDFVPLKYMIAVLRMVYLKGSGFSDLSREFAALCGFALFFNGWAVISYRKTI